MGMRLQSSVCQATKVIFQYGRDMKKSRHHRPYLLRERCILYGFGDVYSTLLQTGLQVLLHLDEGVAQVDEVVLQLRDAFGILQPPDVPIHRPMVQLRLQLNY